MGTPLKNLSALLSPRMLSPKLLNLPKSEVSFKNKKFFNGNENHLRVNSVAKKLEFSKTNQKHFLSPIQIKVTGCEETSGKTIKETQYLNRDYLINTPNKLDLLKNGLETNKVINLLGKGTFGTVFRGIYKDKIVAVKIAKHKNALREKNALNLNHGNVIKILDVVENSCENYCIILMEYFKNYRNLQSVLEDLEFEVDSKKTIRWAMNICEGLKYCHENSVLHLDLKPTNILVGENGCKICDFGNSVNVLDVNENFEYQGTVIYTAPEILLGQLPSTKSDIFSLGIILWQMIYRINPYHEMDNNETVIYQVVKCNLRPSYNLSDSLCEIYTKCWNSIPSERPKLNEVMCFLKTSR